MNENIKVKIDEINNLVNLGKTENRKLTDEEYNKVMELKKEIIELRKPSEVKIKTNRNNMEQFNLLKAIREVAENRNFSDENLAVINAGRKEFEKAGLTARGQITLPTEYRSEIVAGTQYAGQEIVKEDKLDLIGALRANSVLVQAGANLLTGLSANVSIPIYAGSSVDWKGETSIAVDGGGAFSEVDLQPYRLTGFIDISKQFLIQDSVGANSLLMNDLTQAIMEKLENTILGTTTGTTHMAGLFSGTPSYVFTGATTWNAIVSMESNVAGNNALKGSLGYLFHPSTLGTLKTTPKTATYGDRFIAEDTLVNGYKYFVTTNMPTVNSDQKAALFGNFQDLIIAQFGGIDVVVDLYSQAIYGKIRIVVNAYFDAALRRSVSFAKAGLK